MTIDISAPAMAHRLAHEFFVLCNEAYESYLLRKHLFDESADKTGMDHPHHRHLFHRLEDITQKFWLLQLAKLHDPTVQSGRINLTIDYMVDYGGWDTETSETLKALRTQLQDFYLKISKARNKIIAHNDLLTILSAETHGEFESGADKPYFEALQEFVSVITSKAGDRPMFFSALVINDVSGFLSDFNRGVRARIGTA